jgi:hypothetical protein
MSGEGTEAKQLKSARSVSAAIFGSYLFEVIPYVFASLRVD